MKRAAPLLLLAMAACGKPAHAPPSGKAGNAKADAASAAPVLVAAAAETSGPELPKTLDATAVDAWIVHQIKTRGLVGASVAVVDHGKVILAKGYGKKSVASASDDVTPDTAFGIGSVTKEMTCACALLLAERHKMSLDDKVAKYFPELTRAKDITLDDVLAHVAGYPDYYPLDFLDSRMKKATTPDAVVAEYAKKPLDFEPRTKWSYSNTGYLVAGRAVEKASGEELGAFMAKNIFAPLGMKHAALDGAGLTDISKGHTSVALADPEIVPLEAHGWLHAAGGVFMTASDLAAWDMGVVDHKVLSPASFTKLTTPRTLADGSNTQYACGLAVSTRNGDLAFAHSGAVSGFAAYNAFVPRTHSAVVLLVNGDFGSPGAMHNDLFNWLVNLSSTHPPPKVQGAAAKEAAAALFAQMQKGSIDRAQLAEEFSAYLTDARLRAAAPRLAAMGEPKKVELVTTSERGGDESAVVDFTFATGRVRVQLFRRPDGKVEQILLQKR